MKRISRREFAKKVGEAAIVGPALAGVAALSPAAFGEQTPAPQQAPAADAKPGLPPELQERLRQVLERDARRRAQMRPSPLPYDLEPAFVFSVRRHPRGPQTRG